MVDKRSFSSQKWKYHPFDGFRESIEYANEVISELQEENSRIPKLEA